MASWEQQQFLKSWWSWRSSLPEDQRWMADAMACSATHSADVQGYEAGQGRSLEHIASWLSEQSRESWEEWGKGWQPESWISSSTSSPSSSSSSSSGGSSSSSRSKF